MTKTAKCTLALLAALLLVLSACSKEETPGPTEPDDTTGPEISSTTEDTEPTEPETEPAAGVEYERQSNEYTLLGDDGAELIRVHTARPVVELLPGVSDYYSDWIANTEYYISLSQEDAQRQYDDLKSIGRDFYPYTFDTDFNVMRNDGVLFSVLRTYTEETSGAHGRTDYMAENFVTDSGALLTMDDLFAVPRGEYYPRIKEAVLEKIDELYGGEVELILFQGYEQSMMEVYDPMHFCVTDSGVIFFWQVYELGPYTSGAQLFEISFDKLADILNATWIT